MTDDWHKLYGGKGWKDEIVPEAFSHPAKFSRKLIAHIYKHMSDEGWLHEGDAVLDPFGGVALGALDAMRLGLTWAGCELEQRFVDLGAQNIALWNARYASMPHWGSARLLQGDSRELCKVLGAACDAAVSSPPFESSDNRGNREQFDKLQAAVVRDGKGHGGKLGPSIGQDYGNTDGNIGNATGDTFWSAARVIVAQTYAALRPGAHAVWVVKSYVKDKQIVPFPEQWQALCEAAGFVTVHVHRAWLVEHRGTQIDLEGNGHEKKVERKSFFRRLAENKGSPRIDWETVICMEKPGSGGGSAAAVSSPPYIDTPIPKGQIDPTDIAERKRRRANGEWQDYGQTNGNLGNLPPGSLDDALKVDDE